MCVFVFGCTGVCDTARTSKTCLSQLHSNILCVRIFIYFGFNLSEFHTIIYLWRMRYIHDPHICAVFAIFMISEYFGEIINANLRLFLVLLLNPFGMPVDEFIIVRSLCVCFFFIWLVCSEWKGCTARERGFDAWASGMSMRVKVRLNITKSFIYLHSVFRKLANHLQSPSRSLHHPTLPRGTHIHCNATTQQQPWLVGWFKTIRKFLLKCLTKIPMSRPH